MPKEKLFLWICYYYEANDGDRNAFTFISPSGYGRKTATKNAIKIIEDNFDGNWDKDCDLDVFPIEKEDEANGKSHKIIVK